MLAEPNTYSSNLYIAIKGCRPLDTEAMGGIIMTAYRENTKRTSTTCSRCSVSSWIQEWNTLEKCFNTMDSLFKKCNAK